MKTTAKMKVWGVALLAISMFAMSGCNSGGSSSSSGGGGTVYNPYGYTGAVPGVSSPASLGVYPAQYPSAPYLNFSIQFIGEASTAAYYGGSMAYYVGNMGMSGSFTVGAASYVGYCVLPAGNYSFQTTTQGYASGGSVQGTLQGTASGTGGTLTIAFVSTVVYSYSTRASSRFYVTSVNGMSCGNDPGFVLN